MIPPLSPANEPARVSMLHSLDILDTASEERFDRATRVARHLFDVPLALVSLVDSDRQWFKSCAGELDACQTPRDISFCGHAILGDDVFLVPDAARDPRFADNPLVTGAPHIRFYAGFPLTVGHGLRLGTLCVIDTVARQFSDKERRLLRDIGSMTASELHATVVSVTDDLTGVFNRRGLSAAADTMLDHCRRSGAPASLLYFDLDGFKAVNDRFGHDEGDAVLRAFGAILRAGFGGRALVARTGGDEFVVLLPESEFGAASSAALRVERDLDAWVAGRPHRYPLRCSVGVATFGSDALPGLDSMIAAADGRMYAVKQRRAG